MLKPRFQAHVLSLGTSYGSLHTRQIDRLRLRLKELAEADEPTIVLLDFSDTRYFGAAFLGMLIRSAKRLARRGKRLALCGLLGPCLDLVRMAGLDRKVRIYPQRESALRQFPTIERRIFETL